MPRLLILAAFVLLLVLPQGDAATVTLFGVSAPAADEALTVPFLDIKFSQTISAIGTGSDGMTTYEQVNVYTAEIEHLSDHDQTLVTTPFTTVTATFEENASHLVFRPSSGLSPQTLSNGDPDDSIFNPNLVQEECEFDTAKSTGSCVFTQLGVQPVETMQSGSFVATSTETRAVFTTSWTGPLIPVATVTTSDGASAIWGGQQRYTVLSAAVVVVVGGLLLL